MIELVFNELSLCELIDDCDTVTVDSDGKLKCFKGKPTYFESVGKWLLDGDGKTYIIGENYGMGIYKNHSQMIISDDNTDEHIMKGITYPLQGVGGGLEKGLSVSKVKNLEKSDGYDIIIYRFRINYSVNNGNNNYVHVKTILELEMDSLGNYDIRSPRNIEDRYIEVSVSNPKHKQYIMENHDYVYSGMNEAFIVTDNIDSEYKEIISNLLFNYPNTEIGNLVKKASKYV